MGSADDRLRLLGDEVGDGIIEARCIVDQPYAQIEHERGAGTGANYLWGPMVENVNRDLSQIASGLVTSEGSRLGTEMRDYAEKMSDYVFANANVLKGDLRASASPRVVDNGVTVYDRPARRLRRD